MIWHAPTHQEDQRYGLYKVFSQPKPGSNLPLITDEMALNHAIQSAPEEPIIPAGGPPSCSSQGSVHKLPALELCPWSFITPWRRRLGIRLCCSHSAVTLFQHIPPVLVLSALLNEVSTLHRPSSFAGFRTARQGGGDSGKGFRNGPL